MAISFTRYISIISGVGGNAAVARRDLLGRIFTDNDLLPTGTIIEFESADNVGTYFGFTSEEYKRAAFYFGWISKQITAAKKIAFARWAKSAVEPMVFGVSADRLLASFTGISNGSISITMGATTNVISGLDFTGDASLADVAATIQAGINAETGVMWTAATVSYNATEKRFELVGGSAVDAAMSVAAGGVGTEIRTLIGWTTAAIYSDGSAIQTIAEVLAGSTALSDNFGSFCFMPSITNDEIVTAADWNQTYNNKFQFHVAVTAANASTLSPLIVDKGGVGMTLDPETANEYPEMIPMTILAATNYSRRNAAKNYMFQQFDVTDSVTTDADADLYDGLRINYSGVTQTAGQYIAFYQRGFLCGGNTDAQDMSVYANEQWFKDACGATIMSLLLSLDQVEASSEGEAKIMSVLQSVIDEALFNGTIQVGKTLNSTQKLYISEQTGDPDAWQQIQSVGYWCDVQIEQYTVDDLVQYKATYIVIYAKGDSVRKVEGTDILI